MFRLMVEKTITILGATNICLCVPMTFEKKLLTMKRITPEGNNRHISDKMKKSQ